MAIISFTAKKPQERLGQSFILPPDAVVRAHLNPGNADNVWPMERLRAASPESAGHNEHTSHIARPRCAVAQHRLTPAAAGHWSTSTSSVPWCTRWPPCRLDPGSPPRLVPGCRPRPPAPGPPNLHVEQTICLDKFLISACPFYLLNPPLFSLLIVSKWHGRPARELRARCACHSSLLIRQSTFDRVCTIKLFEGQHPGHFMRQRQPRQAPALLGSLRKFVADSTRPAYYHGHFFDRIVLPAADFIR